MKKILVVAVVFALLGFAASAVAQTRPTQATFTPSTDHATVTGYTIGYFPSGAMVPVQTAALGKPTPNSENVITVALDTSSLPAGAEYTGRVKAIGAGVESEWSAPSNTFPIEPLQPVGVTMTTAQKVQLTLTPTPAGTIPAGTPVTWTVEGQTSTNIMGTFAEATMGGGVTALSVWYLPSKSGTHIVHGTTTIDGSTFDASVTITVSNVKPTSVAIVAGTPVAK